jgi:PAS domain S-box-containing protein
VGSVFSTGTYNVCNDIAGDPRMVPWADTARQLGFCATASFPIKLGGATIGALVLGAGEVDYFKDDEIQLMSAVAGHLSFTLQGLQKEDQRLQAENALRESEGRFRGMFAAAAIGIAISTPRGCFLSANEAYCKMLGYTEEELQVRDFASLTHPDDLTLNLELRDDLLAGRRESFVMEKRYLPKGGGILWIRASVSATRSASGEVTSFIVVSEDITQKKVAETALRQSEERSRQMSAQLAKVLDSSLDVICTFDVDGRFLQVSAACEKIWGYRPEELAGTLFLDRVHPEDRLMTDEAAAEVRAGKPTIGFENRCVRKDGTTTHIMWSARWSESDQSMFCVARDNTERRKLEEQFLRAQRMESIGALAGGIAHDLNNVLVPIMMSIDLLRLPGVSPRAQSILTTIESSARRGADMVQQILSFARGVEEQRAVIEAGPVIRDIQSMVVDTFPKNIRFHVELAPGLPPFIGDSTQMHQVLLNLCVNARDAMPAGGSITLSAMGITVDETQAALIPDARPGPYVQIKVQDTGSGIPPEVLDKIFAPFFTTKELGKGTGLGLSTVLGIVKNHGGFLRVQSTVGQGTAFTLCLPAHLSGGGAAAAQEEQTHPRGNGELILVVDDEAAVRAITQETLESFGYRVLTAEDGTEAVALYAGHVAEVDVVLTDMMMPVMDGPATIQVLMQINPAVKIIAASGLNAEGIAAKAAGMGVKHFLPKPYTSLALLMTLKRTLEPVGV